MDNVVHYTSTCLYVMAAIIVVTVAHSYRTGSPLQGGKTTSNEQYDSLVIDKEGNRYTIKKIGDNNLWITDNLRLAVPGSYYYNDSAQYGGKYGRLYTWEAAQAGCALLGEGWRLPSKEEWQDLEESYGALGREEIKIEKRAYLPLLSGGNSKFNAVLGGGRNSDGSYARLEAHGFYWTVSEDDHNTAWFANFAKGSQALYLQADGEKVNAFSVRCVKSKQALKQ